MSMTFAPVFGRIALAAFLLGAGCFSARAEDTVEVRLTLRDHKFEPSEVKVAAGAALVITVTNHDSTPEEFESTSLKVEKIVAPNSEAKVRLRGLKPGRYEFWGEYHDDTARGVLIVE
jgi:plastocyanin